MRNAEHDSAMDFVGTGPFGMKILVGFRLFFEIEWGDFTP